MNVKHIFLGMAETVGHDLLLGRYPHHELHSIWLNYGEVKKIEVFKEWLGAEANRSCLVFLDDIDGIETDDAIREALPRDAHMVLTTTRDPSLAIELRSNVIRVSDLGFDDMGDLIRDEMAIYNFKVDRTDVDPIIRYLKGHPLAGCRAASYIASELSHSSGYAAVKEFIWSWEGQDWSARRTFLDYKPRADSLSIMETFEISVNRLGPAGDSIARGFLDAIAFTCDADTINFRSFFSIERPWLQEASPHLPDCQIFEGGLRNKTAYLKAFEKVSLGTRKSVAEPLHFHPLWLECIRQRCGHGGRSRWLRQILLLCYYSWRRGDKRVLPYAKNCLQIAWHFGIHREELSKVNDVISWLSRLARLPTVSRCDI